MSTDTRRTPHAPPTNELDHAADAGILASVLGAGAGGGPARIAERLLARYEITRLPDVAPEQLAAIPGVGPRRAARVLAALELGRRAFGGGAFGPVFDSPESVVALNEDLVSERREHFVAVLLNARHRIVRRLVVSIGSLNASIVHPREVFHDAIRESAAAIVLVHNHPSGDPAPSRDDVEITRRLVRAGDLLGIPVLDHVVVARAGYTSLRREGLVTDGSWRGGTPAFGA